jgi:predicted alpha/beta superfamily hydrolase
MTLHVKVARTYSHDEFEVVAAGLGRYTIDVSLPREAQTGGAKFPVILVTDGNILFDIAQTVMHGRATSLGSFLPPSIVVGVGYPADEGPASYYGRRNFDFHGNWDMTDPVGRTLQAIFTSMKEAEGKHDLQMRAGGFERFLGFLRDELLPSLADHYPVDLRARHTLIGDSSGGHFVLRALYAEHSPFSRYVCISPGFGSAEGTIRQAEAAFAATHADLDVDLFICCGQCEVDLNSIYAAARFGSGITWVAEQFALRNWPSARVHWEIMNNEDHQSIAARAISAGLRSVHHMRPGVHTEELKTEIAKRLAAVVSSK